MSVNGRMPVGPRPPAPPAPPDSPRLTHYFMQHGKVEACFKGGRREEIDFAEFERRQASALAVPASMRAPSTSPNFDHANQMRIEAGLSPFKPAPPQGRLIGENGVCYQGPPADYPASDPRHGTTDIWGVKAHYTLYPPGFPWWMLAATLTGLAAIGWILANG